jgi:hypothetical protein
MRMGAVVDFLVVSGAKRIMESDGTPMDHGGLAGVIVERHSMGVGPAPTAKPRATQTQDEVRGLC